jgi:hypothetical protein
MRACPSRISSLGVVPEPMRAWKPLTAPQAMVMKQNGKTLPAKTGPVPSTKRVSGGIRMAGRTNRMPQPRARIAPTLMNALR